ncbi:MAG: hypothetical protein IIW86_05620, partial [Clostridia bacterium]|nr:hypothetical protein [Clostridia bacterium]
DTHMTENVCKISKEELLEKDIYPYIELNKKGLLPAVMTTHSIFANVDPEYPATFSKKILDILRDKGFTGVYFADSLAMMSVLHKYDEETTYSLCMKAGIDIILPDYPPRQAPVTICLKTLMKRVRLQQNNLTMQCVTFWICKNGLVSTKI